MGGVAWAGLGGFAGIICLLTWIVSLTGISSSTSRQRWVLLLVCASFFGVFGVVAFGSHWYRLEQEDAKNFIDRRIAEIRATRGANGPFPATQQEFVGTAPLPRLLKGKTFYRLEKDGNFEIFFSVDWDGGWGINSYHFRWTRST